MIEDVKAIEATLSATAMPERGRILVIDDDPSIRATIRVILEQEGFQVAEAENGEIGIRCANTEVPDLIITDWEMPVLDGRTTIERLRENQQTRTVPIVMLTVRSRSDDRVAALEAGAQDFIGKPFERRELVACVKQQLRWRRLLSSAVEPELEDGLPAELSALEAAKSGGDPRAILAAAVAGAERAEELGSFKTAAECYRQGADAATAMGNPDLANKLLRLAGKMYLCLAESSPAEAEQAERIEDAYALAARMFMAAGNLRLAKQTIERAE